jgi:hypothetical protein
MGFFNSSFMFESSLAGARQNSFTAKAGRTPWKHKDFSPHLNRPVERHVSTLNTPESQIKNLNEDPSHPEILPTAFCLLSTFLNLLFYNLLETGGAVADRLDRFVVRLTIDKPFVSFLEVVTFRSVLFPIMFNRLLSFLF